MAKVLKFFERRVNFGSHKTNKVKDDKGNVQRSKPTLTGIYEIGVHELTEEQAKEAVARCGSYNARVKQTEGKLKGKDLFEKKLVVRAATKEEKDKFEKAQKAK